MKTADKLFAACILILFLFGACAMMGAIQSGYEVPPQEKSYDSE